VFIFMAWSVSLIYMVVGPAYRLSLMGAFTAPLVFLIQTFALVSPFDRPRPPKMEVNGWLEFHASMSIVAYGAFALACIAGLMYLLQERQLKRRKLRSVFHHLPPLTELYSAITRLLWLGFILYTGRLVSGFFHRRAAARREDELRDRRVAFLRGDPAGAGNCSGSVRSRWRCCASSRSRRRCRCCGESRCLAEATALIRHEPFCVGSAITPPASMSANDMFRARMWSAPCAKRRVFEALVLSTCNRVEVYAVADERLDTAAIARCLTAGGDEFGNDAAAFYRFDHEACVQHLFRVAAGLDSMVVGETEVLGQAKQAYEKAVTPVLPDRVCTGCFSVHFEWQRACARTRRSRVARSPSARSLSNSR
jgi:hypothetical protein